MSKTLRYLILFLLASTTSCSVYAPLQPGAPTLRDKGQAEVAGSVYLSGRYEGAVAYSPVRHVLVRAAGGFRPDNSANTYFRTRQLEVGAGTYWPLGQRWLVGGMGGYGWGRGSRNFNRTSRLTSSIADTAITYDYAARFGKVFGEAFVAYEDGPVTFGLAYRLSQVRFSTLTNNGLPVDLRRMTRNEPMLFMRVGSKQGVLQWARLQVAFSTSSSTDAGRRNVEYYQQLEDVKEARIFTTIGLVVYPHLFKRASSGY